jgi:CBS domain-containing protein
MSNVAKILQSKNYGIISVSSSTAVIDALEIMAKNNIGSILVMEGGVFLGLFTERDYARKVILKDKSSSQTTVGEIMSTDLPRVSPRDTVEQCMKLISEYHVRYLPVFDQGKLVGIVSILDLIQETVSLQKETISHLQEFISSNFA